MKHKLIISEKSSSVATSFPTTITDETLGEKWTVTVTSNIPTYKSNSKHPSQDIAKVQHLPSGVYVL